MEADCVTHGKARARAGVHAEQKSIAVEGNPIFASITNVTMANYGEQPVTRAEISCIRGTDSSGVIREAPCSCDCRGRPSFRLARPSLVSDYDCRLTTPYRPRLARRTPTATTCERLGANTRLASAGVARPNPPLLHLKVA